MLALNIYEATNNFPRNEMYGLTSQIRRAAVSIPTNISEGCGKYSGKDFARYLQISMGSASELEYLIFLSNELKLIESSRFTELNSNIVEIKKMLASLIKKLRAKD